MIYDFTLDQTQMISISIYDTQGKLIKTLFNDQVSSGENRLTFNTYYLEQGMYIIRISGNTNVLETKKFIKGY